MAYTKEIWIGRIAGVSYNWEIKGIDEDDYALRIDWCNEAQAEIDKIKEYYESCKEDRDDT